MRLQPGARLGPYEILAPLGAGGMGEVYRARDTRLGRDVAVKILSPDTSASPEARQRFEREARTISQLSHPHICALYDVGEAANPQSPIPNPYLVMELLDGETLAQRLASGALPLELTLRYATQIADALEKAHRAGIVHRDLKPANVMLTKAGVKLLDFGLAKAVAAGPAPPNGETMAAASPITARGRHRRHRAVHGAGANRGTAGGRAHGHLCVRGRDLRDGDRDARVRERAASADAGGARSDRGGVSGGAIRMSDGSRRTMCGCSFVRSRTSPAAPCRRAVGDRVDAPRAAAAGFRGRSPR